MFQLLVLMKDALLTGYRVIFYQDTKLEWHICRTRKTNHFVIYTSKCYNVLGCQCWKYEFFSATLLQFTTPFFSLVLSLPWFLCILIFISSLYPSCSVSRLLPATKYIQLFDLVLLVITLIYLLPLSQTSAEV